MKHGVVDKAGALAMILAITLPTWAWGSELSRQDIEWLDRVTYGPNTVTADHYLKVGRRQFFDEQLHPQDLRLPPLAATQVDALEFCHTNSAALLATVFKEQQRITALTDETQKQTARKALNDRGNKLAYEAAGSEILRALYYGAFPQSRG